MSRPTHHKVDLPVSLIAALFLGALIALFWVTAARGTDVPREVIAWLSGRKPNAVSALYDALVWTAMIALFASAMLAVFFGIDRRRQ